VTDPIDPAALGNALRRARRAKQLSLRDLAVETGVSFNTLSRVERGFVPDVKNYSRIIDWLGLPPAAMPGIRSDGTPDSIARHLSADPRLTPESAEQIAELVREMYQQLAEPTPAYAVHLRSHQTFRPAAGEMLAEIIGEMHSALERTDT
jgi:transcriptional regulator with XRE-family HTH domain